MQAQGARAQITQAMGVQVQEIQLQGEQTAAMFRVELREGRPQMEAKEYPEQRAAMFRVEHPERKMLGAAMFRVEHHKETAPEKDAAEQIARGGKWTQLLRLMPGRYYLDWIRTQNIKAIVLFHKKHVKEGKTKMQARELTRAQTYLVLARVALAAQWDTGAKPDWMWAVFLRANAEAARLAMFRVEHQKEAQAMFRVEHPQETEETRQKLKAQLMRMALAQTSIIHKTQELKQRWDEATARLRRLAQRAASELPS